MQAANDTEATPDLKVTLSVGPDMRQHLVNTNNAIALANSYELDPADPDSDSIAAAAQEDLRSLKQRAAQIETMRVDFVKPAREIIEKAQGYFKPAITTLQEAAGIIDRKLVAWTRGRERLAAEAKAKAEAEARRLREEAERKAAAERARAEEQERAARQKAEAAEAERKRQAEAAERARREGDARAAADAERKAQAAAAERAQQEERERLAREEGERKAREAQVKAAAEAEAQRSAAAPAPATTLAGRHTRDNWTAELEPGKTDDDVKILLAAAITGGRTDLLPLLDINLGLASKLAKAQKSLMKVPGLRAVNNPLGVTRSKA